MNCIQKRKDNYLKSRKGILTNIISELFDKEELDLVILNKSSKTVKTVKRKVPFQDPTESLDLGNSGTGARLLAGFLSGLGINATITGDKSLSSRPMKRIVEPLTKMGFELNSNNHRLPLEIIQSNGSSFFEYNSPISSAQVKSSILLAALTGSIETKITEPIGSRDHTERMLKHFGADIPVSYTHLTLPTKRIV